jgi:hypothetical protein
MRLSMQRAFPVDGATRRFCIAIEIAALRPTAIPVGEVQSPLKPWMWDFRAAAA